MTGVHRRTGHRPDGTRVSLASVWLQIPHEYWRITSGNGCDENLAIAVLAFAFPTERSCSLEVCRLCQFCDRRFACCSFSDDLALAYLAFRIQCLCRFAAVDRWRRTTVVVTICRKCHPAVQRHCSGIRRSAIGIDTNLDKLPGPCRDLWRCSNTRFTLDLPMVNWRSPILINARLVVSGFGVTVALYIAFMAVFPR